LRTIKEHHAEDIFTGWLILAFLEDQEKVSNYDLDRLVEMLNGIRLARLGKKPNKVVDAVGNVICECNVPMPYTPVKDYGVAMEEAKKRLAECLLIPVKDKFIPRFEYETTKLTKEIREMYKQLANVLSGHPAAPCQPTDQPVPSEQKTTPEETNPDEQPDEAVNAEAAIPEQTAVPECNLYYSPEAVKARLEADKEFAAKVGPRTCNTPYPWEDDQ